MVRPHHPIRSISNEAYIDSPTVGQSRTQPWLGPLEHAILSKLLETGLRVFRPSDLDLNIDRRRLWDALQRLASRGIIEKISRGVYRVREGLAKVITLPTRKLSTKATPVKDKPMEAKGTREPRGGVSGGVGVVGPFFDNVRGVSLGGFVFGDRGRVRGLGELVFFERVSYAEVLYRVSGFVLPGQLVVYSNSQQDGEAVRVEWRPPRGFVRGNGVGGALRMYWWVVFGAFRALAELLLREAPWDVRRFFLRFVSSRLGGLVCVG